MNRKEEFEFLKNNYKVNNLVNKYKKVLFILESPHIDELLCSAPVSGLSGKMMFKKLFGEVSDAKLAIGPYLKQRPENKFGIINICPVPMQMNAYESIKVTSVKGYLKEGSEGFISELEKIRVQAKKSYKENGLNETQEIVLEDFRNELLKLRERELILIPCGKTAQNMFSLANIDSEKWSIINDIPHPSFNNWSKVKYTLHIEKMLKKINK